MDLLFYRETQVSFVKEVFGLNGTQLNNKNLYVHDCA